MKFIISSTDLLQSLMQISRVIVSKSPLPILENFLFQLKGNELTLTASDSETTLRTVLNVAEVEAEGEISIPAKLLMDTLKELPTQPIELNTLDEKSVVSISWTSGSAQIPFLPTDNYPELPQLQDAKELNINAALLSEGINNTLYATGDEELRPVMNGIFFDITPDQTTLVASNAHKLVYFTRTDIKGNEVSSFILPKKPANILKNNLSKYGEEDIVSIAYDSKNAFFKYDNSLLVCRLVDGTYPAYRSVIPKNNSNVLTISRNDILNATKRVAVCSNQATSQIVFKISQNFLEISAQDTDFSMSAKETVNCEYEGAPMEIGFKSTFLIEILSNLPYDQICIKLADPNRAALIQPLVQASQEEEICALLMPMRINS